MYDHSPRKLTQAVTQTKAYVGPGTYILCNPKFPESYPPFKQGAPKTPTFIRKAYTDVFYDVTDVKANISGGSSPRNREERLKYPPQEPAVCPDTSSPPRKPRKLYVCHVPYRLDASAPSVPTKNDENGYDIDRYGFLVKNPPTIPESGSMRRLYTSDTLSNGWKWSARTSKRFRRQLSTGPGPADYDLESQKGLETLAMEEFRENARRYSFLPRYIEAQQLKEERQQQPGPGHYDPYDCHCLISPGIHPRPFISKAPRFRSTSIDGPPVGLYEHPDKFGATRGVSLAPPPFGTATSRLAKPLDAATPGPGNYDIPRVKCGCSCRRVPFNSTAERWKDDDDNDDFVVCPPDTPKQSVQPSWVFRSSVGRHIVPQRQYCVEPASYNISEIYNRMKNKKSHNFRKVPFNIGCERRSDLRPSTITPGPTDYDPMVKRHRKGNYFGTLQRFSEIDGQIPPVGYYQINTLLESSMARAYISQNSRLQANICRKAS